MTRARAVQHGDNTRCNHAMMSGECAENAPEEQVRLDHREEREKEKRRGGRQKEDVKEEGRRIERQRERRDTTINN